jgi:hypothetical protein
MHLWRRPLQTSACKIGPDAFFGARNGAQQGTVFPLALAGMHVQVRGTKCGFEQLGLRSKIQDSGGQMVGVLSGEMMALSGNFHPAEHFIISELDRNPSR